MEKNYMLYVSTIGSKWESNSILYHSPEKAIFASNYLSKDACKAQIHDCTNNPIGTLIGESVNGIYKKV